MYGLVNRAIEELVIAEAGRSIWETIKRKAGVTVPSFVSMKPYPDAMTYDLVAAASEVMEVPADELLCAFGKHWILFTAAQGYGPALEMAGSDLREFVGNKRQITEVLRIHSVGSGIASHGDFLAQAIMQQIGQQTNN